MDVLGTWQEEFDRLMGRLKSRFAHSQSRVWARAYLQGLLSNMSRKNGWQLAQNVGAATPYGLQQFLYRAKWNADDIRDDLRTYVVEHLSDPAAVLVIDETGFVKKGSQSVGVQAQYWGTAGRVTNCQVGVFVVYASAKGATFVDRALYLPESWTNDRERCRKVGVPDEVAFATKPELAQQMLKGAVGAGVPAAWVTGDSAADRARNSTAVGQLWLARLPAPDFVWAWSRWRRRHQLSAKFYHYHRHLLKNTT